MALLSEPCLRGRGLSTQRRLEVVGLLNLAYALVQIFGSLSFNSLGLMSDGFHNLSDVVSTVCAIASQRIQRMPATPRYPFGLKRAEVLGGFVNGISLLCMSGFVALQAMARIFRPEETNGSAAFIVIAGSGVVINLASALLLVGANEDEMPVCAHDHTHGHAHGHGHATRPKGSGRRGGKVEPSKGIFRAAPRAGLPLVGKARDAGEEAADDERISLVANEACADVEEGGTASRWRLGSNSGGGWACAHGGSCAGHDHTYDHGTSVSPAIGLGNSAGGSIPGAFAISVECPACDDSGAANTTQTASGANDSKGDHLAAGDQCDTDRGDHGRAGDYQGDANVWAVVLHSLTDAVASIMVTIEAVAVFFAERQGARQGGGQSLLFHVLLNYADPVLSILLAGAIAVSVYPFVKRCGLQLLDVVPEVIDVEQVKEDLRKSHTSILQVPFFSVRSDSFASMTKGEAVAFVRVVTSHQPGTGTSKVPIDGAVRTVLRGYAIREAFVDVRSQ